MTLNDDDRRRLSAVLERTASASPDGERLAALTAAERILSKAGMRMSNLVDAAPSASGISRAMYEAVLRDNSVLRVANMHLRMQLEKLKSESARRESERVNADGDARVWLRYLEDDDVFDRLGVWEKGFVDSISDRVESGRDLTQRQIDKLREVAQRYGFKGEGR
jgi:hypothetical protein